MARLRGVRIVVGKLRLEKLDWGANDVDIYWKFHLSRGKLYEVQIKGGHSITKQYTAHCAYLDSSPLRPSQASQRQMSLSNVGSQGADDIERQQRRAQNLRIRTCFRVLIIGRANAGKTTILQRVCNTTEEPKIFNWKGHEVFHVLDIIMNHY